jgi:hypothetical protein
MCQNISTLKWFLEYFQAVIDLAPDGKSFAVVLYPDGTADQAAKPITSVTVLLNFFDELRRLVPAGGK